MPSIRRSILAMALCFWSMAVLPNAVGSADKTPTPGLSETVRIATEAYIYGYPWSPSTWFAGSRPMWPNRTPNTPPWGR
jgi:hypothetical protein